MPIPESMSLRAGGSAQGPAVAPVPAPANDVQLIELLPADELPEPEEAPPAQPQLPALPKSGPPPDPTLLRAIEPLLQRASWHELQLLLATKTHDPLTLSPVFGLLYAIALKEDPAVLADDPHKPHVHAEQVGITVVSRLLRIPDDSAAATLIAKRLLRSRPQDNDNARASLPALFVSGIMLVGALAGFLLHAQLLGWLGK
jgi:hypothetical protein